jgi:glucose-6-phosphate dehydrogenase assembly protein OpcA
MAAVTDLQIPDIQKELQKIADQQKEDGPRRASLFTLILFAPSSKRVAHLQKYRDKILEKFPCRVIFIQADEEAEQPYFHVKVSSIMCGDQNGGGSDPIACDEITIEASNSELFRIPFIVFPNLIPDLPSYLLWGKNPFDEKDVFPALQPYITRVVFDSECSDNLHLFCEEMLANLNLSKVELMDINWALVSNWRDMICQLFSTPEKVEQLASIKSITITYNDNEAENRQHSAIRALYLQGWLASRLKWQYDQIEKNDRNFIISYSAQGSPLIVTLSPQAYLDLPIGALSSIEITTKAGDSYFIARKLNLSQVVVHESSYEKCALPFTLPLPSVHKGLNFMKEIFFKQLGNHYRGTLKMISQIDYKVLSSK